LNTSAHIIIRGELYAGYALDLDIRANASSGGIVSAILIDLLESGQIDGALVSRITSKNERITAVTEIARTREEIYLFGGSSYIDTPVIQKVQELKGFPGRLAVVALPCQARALQALFNHHPELRKTFPFIIGLFCRGNVTKLFYEDYFKRNHIDIGKIETLKVQRGHLQGDVTIRFVDGTDQIIPFLAINTYRLAGIHPKALCAWCAEHISEDADISVGDIFSPEFKREPIKHSAFIPRNEEGVKICENLISREVISARLVGLDIYHKSFRKIESFSNNLAPRYLAARLLGLKVPDKKPVDKKNLFHTMAWFFLFINRRLSNSNNGRSFLFRLPTPIISLMALIIKSLSRL
jgi:coenzyme F420-reducing hydrogenase beta subunit